MVTEPLAGAMPVDGRSGSWTPRLALSLASIVLLLELLSFSYIMISTSMPMISAEFQTTQGAWLLTSFLIVGSVAAPLVGKLADTHGKRRMLLVCMAISLVGWLISAVAQNYGQLIVGRAIAGMMVPTLFLSYSLIRDVYPSRIVPLAVSIATSGMGLVAVPAPFLSGWLLDSFGFRSMFWFGAIVLVILGVSIRAFTDESPVRLRASIDLFGAVVLGSGLACVLVAISFGPTWGWAAGSTLAFLLGGVVLLAGWLASARVIREPLIDLNVLKQRPVYLTSLGAGFVYGTSGLFLLLLPMLAMTPLALGLGYGYGVSAEGFAIFQAPIGAMVVAGGIVVGTLVGRGTRPRSLMILASLLMASAATCVAVSSDPKLLLIAFSAAFGLGTGMAYATIPNLLFEAVPPQLQASTASIVGVMQSVFPAVLPVIAFAVLNNSYIAPLADEITQGATFYTSEGYRAAFIIVAISGIIAAVVAFCLPRHIRQVDVSGIEVRTDTTALVD
ncbi:MFS transporter [Gordonia sp. LSe1-13]|uniref:MFS transporter n=1 Tax=Gordonia sesuvii TaxID=3116777 RepID=A0ABU7M9B1_9ACTN|nr:MFS transporter [Gordonia sp. LSe1-13]